MRCAGQRSGGAGGGRFEQLLRWCGPTFEGLLLFDECHKARNLRIKRSGSGGAAAAIAGAGAGDGGGGDDNAETRDEGGVEGKGGKRTVAAQVVALQAALPHAGVVYCRCAPSPWCYCKGSTDCAELKLRLRGAHVNLQWLQCK